MAGIPNTIDSILSDVVLHEPDALPTGCWTYTVSLNDKGYGKAALAGKKWRVHRLVFDILRGNVDEHPCLDHLCRNRACCNPYHLEPVTKGVNVLRGETNAAKNLTKTHCPRGHPYSGENLYAHPSGRRCCKECQRINLRNSRRRRKGLNHD